MQQNKNNLIVKLTFDFAFKIIKYCDKLNEQKKFQISDQLFRAGTSVGANVREAQNAESIRDFIHKMKIAAKEGDESQYWLLLCKTAQGFPDLENLCEDIDVINKVLSKIIATSKLKNFNIKPPEK